MARAWAIGIEADARHGRQMPVTAKPAKKPKPAPRRRVSQAEKARVQEIFDRFAAATGTAAVQPASSEPIKQASAETPRLRQR